MASPRIQPPTYSYYPGPAPRVEEEEDNRERQDTDDANRAELYANYEDNGNQSRADYNQQCDRSPPTNYYYREEDYHRFRDAPYRHQYDAMEPPPPTHPLPPFLPSNRHYRQHYPYDEWDYASSMDYLHPLPHHAPPPPDVQPNWNYPQDSWYPPHPYDLESPPIRMMYPRAPQQPWPAAWYPPDYHPHDMVGLETQRFANPPKRKRPGGPSMFKNFLPSNKSLRLSKNAPSDAVCKERTDKAPQEDAIPEEGGGEVKLDGMVLMCDHCAYTAFDRSVAEAHLREEEHCTCSAYKCAQCRQRGDSAICSPTHAGLVLQLARIVKNGNEEVNPGWKMGSTVPYCPACARMFPDKVSRTCAIYS